MSRIKAAAVAYEASRDERHYRYLTQGELEVFWDEVDILRYVTVVRQQHTVRERFWRDQGVKP